jgi:hydroxymethylpyrimidine pyrophosphatase-like HAD family hydrolase
MKVIFLDIDGVLNSWNNDHQLELSKGEYIDEKKVKLLSIIVKSTKSIVVMHSGWRFWFNEKLEPICKEANRLSSLLKKHGIKLFDKTPDFSTEEIRKAKKFSLVKASEILAWLREHEEVKAYIVLDDLNLHNEELAKSQIRTDSAVGLTEKDVIQAIKKLN